VVKNRGFSLIELLIAMVILTAVMALTAQSFSLFTTGWSGRVGRFDQRFEVAKVNLVLQDILQNIVPYAVRDESGRERLYFEGNINGFVAVTRSSMGRPGMPAIVRLSARQRSDFGFDLLYEEYAISAAEPIVLGLPLVFSAPIVIAVGVFDLQFRYFGLSRGGESDRVEDSGARWTDQYDSVQTFRQPLKIQLTWVADGNDGARYVLTERLVQGFSGAIVEANDGFN
jgi:prepilin-type N-terminal cleavage/methylation domain-containing protein